MTDTDTDKNKTNFLAELFTNPDMQVVVISRLDYNRLIEAKEKAKELAKADLVSTKDGGCKLVVANKEWVLPFNRKRWRTFQETHPKEFGEMVLSCLEGFQDIVKMKHFQEGEDPNILKVFQNFICDVECLDKRLNPECWEGIPESDRPIWGE